MPVDLLDVGPAILDRLERLRVLQHVNRLGVSTPIGTVTL